MYFDKDSFSAAEKVDISPIGEGQNIPVIFDCLASQYEIHRQLCREGNDIRNEYFLGIIRKVYASIKKLFETSDEEIARFQEYQELKD